MTNEPFNGQGNIDTLLSKYSTTTQEDPNPLVRAICSMGFSYLREKDHNKAKNCFYQTLMWSQTPETESCLYDLMEMFRNGHFKQRK